MRITIENGTVWQRKHADQFIRWFAKKYLSTKCRRRLKIDVTIYKSKKEVDEFQGLCDDLGGNHFELSILAMPGIPKEGFLQILGHEMTHVRQYAKHELVDLANGNTRFLKKEYSEDFEYWESPWEIEAMGMEKSLMHMYAKAHNVRVRCYLEQRPFR